MSKKKLFKLVSIVASLVGLGMLFGHALGNGTASTALWLGGMLVLLSAVTFGISMATPTHQEADKTTEQ